MPEQTARDAPLDRQRRSMAMMTRVKIVIGIILAIVALIIMFQNTESVSTTLLFWTVSLPHIALLVLMLVVGFILGLVAMSMYHRRRIER